MDEATLRLRTDGLSWREIADEIVAVDVESSRYLSANTTGRLLWKPLAEGTTRSELTRILVDAYGIDQDRAAADVDVFIAELEAEGLLESP